MSKPDKKLKLKVISYTQNDRDKTEEDIVISDEYWTEHKNIDGSILKVKVIPIFED